MHNNTIIVHNPGLDLQKVGLQNKITLLKTICYVTLRCRSVYVLLCLIKRITDLV